MTVVNMFSFSANSLLVLIIANQTVQVYNQSLFTVGNVTTLTEDLTADLTGDKDNITRLYIGSDYCDELNHCDNIRSYSPRCSCDSLCGVLNDCCPGADNRTVLNLTVDQFSCHKASRMDTLMVVSKCPVDWLNSATRALCEHEPSVEDIMSRILVSHKTLDGYVFKNMHCAICNNVSEYIYWKAEFECMNTTEDISKCPLTLEKPEDKPMYRDCNLHNSDVISNCSDNNTSAENEEKCGKESTLLTYAKDGREFKKFKNKYCAYCNGFTEKLLCDNKINDFDNDNTPEFPVLYSFRDLVDFDFDAIFDDGLYEMPGYENGNTELRDCNADDQIYDPVADVCRTIMCPANTQPSQGNCVPKGIGILRAPALSFIGNNTSESIEHCPLSKLNPEEFQFMNNTNQILFRNEIYNDTEYMKNGSDVFLCIKSSDMPTKGRKLQATDMVEEYLSIIGLIISIIALLVTIVVYFTFTELLNIPGKILVSLCISLLVSQLLFLLAPLATTTNVLCIVVAVIMHFSFLSAFSWMNVMAFDLLRTFSSKLAISQRGGWFSKKFIKYCIYCSGIPLVIVCAALFLEFAVENDTFRPHYSEGACWISSRNALLLLFVGPLALFKLFDVVSFVLIVYYIIQAKKQSAMAADKSKSSSFFIYLKLSLVMGLTWIFAFIANFSGSMIIWYLFIIFNTLQGLYIAVSFLCTKKVIRLIKARCCKTKSKYSSGTISTTHVTSVM